MSKDKTAMTVYMEDELYDAIAKLAKKNRRSISQQAATILEMGMPENKVKSESKATGTVQ